MPPPLAHARAPTTRPRLTRRPSDAQVGKLPVKRNGNFTPLDVDEIVPGDLVFLRAGNVIPADCLWIEGDELAVDQAALTGESLPVAVPREDSEG